MANYVKFLRGTPAAFEKLQHKNNDTLYFIYEEDESQGVLYLGSKLIAGCDGDHEVSTGVNFLSDLKDVLLDANLNIESFLVYDINAAAWVNKPFEDLVFVGATNQSAGLPGLIPAPKIGETDLFLKSDGTWAAPQIDHLILTLENLDKLNHSDLIYEAVANLDNQSGDIIIIKDKIHKDKWQYTAYSFDNGNWYAMDGNYDAKNIYFSEDLITTIEVGNISLVNGKATIAAAGKNLKEVFETIFVKEEYPETIEPSISLIFNQAQEYEVGTQITPSYSASLNSGNYTFGPATNVTAKTWLITDTNGNASSLSKGSFPQLTVSDDDYFITAVVTYSDGNIPVTNLGNEYPEGQIKMNSVSQTSNSIIGYRNTFYGTRTVKNELTSDLVRELNHYNKILQPESSIKVNLPKGALQVVFAYPATLPDLSSITDANAFNVNILTSFNKSIMAVEGNNNYAPIDYKIYTINFANPYATANYYTFTIGKED